MIWINKEYLVLNTALDANIEFQKLMPSIESIQEMYVLPLLTKELYDALNTHVTALETSNTPIPADYKNLLDLYVQPVIAHYLVLDMTQLSSVRATKAGFIIRNEDNNTQPSQTQLKMVGDNFRTKAEFYASKLITYLNENKALFPEYKNEEDSSKPFSVDMYFY